MKSFCLIITAIVALFCTSLSSCSSMNDETPQVPEWIKQGASMQALRGIVLRPWPEVPLSEKHYSEMKPHEVNYVFESGAVRVVCYDVNRKVVSEQSFAPGELKFDAEEIRTLQQWEDRLGLTVSR
jgi:hypothetical protein